MRILKLKTSQIVKCLLSWFCHLVQSDKMKDNNDKNNSKNNNKTMHHKLLLNKGRSNLSLSIIYTVMNRELSNQAIPYLFYLGGIGKWLVEGWGRGKRLKLVQFYCTQVMYFSYFSYLDPILVCLYSRPATYLCNLAMAFAVTRTDGYPKHTKYHQPDKRRIVREFVQILSWHYTGACTFFREKSVGMQPVR